MEERDPLHIDLALSEEPRRQRLVRVDDGERWCVCDDLGDPDGVHDRVWDGDELVLGGLDARFVEGGPDHDGPFTRREGVGQTMTSLRATNDDHQLVRLSHGVVDRFHVTHMNGLKTTHEQRSDHNPRPIMSAVEIKRLSSSQWRSTPSS